MSTWIKLRVHRSLEVAGSQALRTDGVSMSIEAGRAFQTENSLGKEWEVGQCREQRWRVSADSEAGPKQGRRRQWGGGTAQGSLVERSRAAHSRGNLGSLQLEVRLRDETVLPSGCYQPLVQLLCREVKLGTQVRRAPREGGRVQGW